ncbi:DNA polymerase III subunit epsilon [Candidatus Palibaumannia cicadellinicola]|uniref:DNA polymerase III subunit epsilon n=1 Tax=Candidatus Palibaumannia cicadellinicola TaxID=186490 RepID=A0A0K2BLD9_9GAMM|nr:DNA polymerase III subunit epsilon [Candidatus Baumannia cicadellinicola]AKZ66009.1 DNA polymerase III epsilon subunit [Candidatus Baumannia cicadellinicola]
METKIKRQVVLDTETTGMNKLGKPDEGHRIIEIGAVEIINRRITGNYFHVYLNPERLIDKEAFAIHGISNIFLQDKPTFAEIADKFIKFISGSELIIHNAKFDISFIDNELIRLKSGMNNLNYYCKVTDSLLLARKIFPGKRNSLDALCDRYLINKSNRIKHGALLDAEILAEIFLRMTGGQMSINFNFEQNNKKINIKNINDQLLLKIIKANEQELIEHYSILKLIKKHSNKCLWII